MTRRMLFLASLALALGGCDAPTAARPSFAYDPTVLTGGVLYRWPSGSTLRVWTDPESHSLEGNLGNAINTAMSEWNDVPEFGEFQLVRALSIEEANIVLYDRVAANPMSAGSCTFDPRGSGYTYFCLPDDDGGVAERLKTRDGILTNVTVVISLDGGRVPSRSDYEAVVAHELGHALGIGAHSSVATDLMFGSPTVTRPSRRDRETLQYVLGQRPSALLR